MKSTVLFALSGIFFTLAISGCASPGVGGSSSAVSGVGDACALNSDCNTGLECEHQSCQPHKGHADAGVAEPGEDDDNDGADGHGDDDHEGAADAGTAPACRVATDCPAGQECDDGRCKLHEENETEHDGGTSGHGGSGGGGEGSDG